MFVAHYPFSRVEITAKCCSTLISSGTKKINYFAKSIRITIILADVLKRSYAVLVYMLICLLYIIKTEAHGDDERSGCEIP